MTGLNQKQWQLATPPPQEFIDSLMQQGMHPVLAEVLYQRGYTTPATVQSFLGLYDDDDNPFRLKGMHEAVYRLRMAIRRGETIAVYGDFDADGVNATALLTGVLKLLGAQVRAYIPDRVDEGYGLNSPALKQLADEGIKVVVTVDCGIRSIQEVADGNHYGLDMIVSDHHSVGPEIPPALAVINPQQHDCSYPDKRLAGVGVAYKIAQALYMEASRRGYRYTEWRPEDWLDLVAIGTVADIMPLVGENRELVTQGLKRLNKPQRAGLKALYEVARIRAGEVTSTTIGFMIGPRINAAGRLESAMLAYRLLTSENANEATLLAKTLNDINRVRQEKTRQMQAWATEALPGEPGEQAFVFASDERFEQGVVGLVASRLTEQHYRPSAVVQIGKEESHGSCRSIPEFHVTRALEHCDDLLERYGGHSMAAGFTVRNENIELLRERLVEIAEDALGERELSPTLSVDAEIDLSDVGFPLIDALQELEPTGEGNPSPLFMTRNVLIDKRETVGKEAQHLKLSVKQGEAAVEALAWRWGEHIDDLPEQVDITYSLEVNEWRNQKRIQLIVQDFRTADNG